MEKLNHLEMLLRNWCSENFINYNDTTNGLAATMWKLISNSLNEDDLDDSYIENIEGMIYLWKHKNIEHFEYVGQTTKVSS